MSYKQPSLWQRQQQSSFMKRRSPQTWPTKVTLHWSQKYGAYALKWHDTGHWDLMQPFMSFLKSNPYGEYMYDGDENIWYFDPKHLKAIQEMFKTMDVDINGHRPFIVDFIPKPENQTFVHKFISIDTYLDKFKELSGIDIRSLEYSKAKKEYFRACMKLHPDKGNDPQKMTELNVAWDVISQEHFKIKKDISYVE